MVHRRLLVVPVMLDGMQQMIDGTKPPPLAMVASVDCLRYLCICLQNSPAHWCVQVHERHHVKWFILDFTPILDTIESSAMGCVYNVRKIQVATDGSQAIFETLDGTDWTWSGESMPSDIALNKLQTYVFFTLVMVQQFSATCYHNWIHFYFNDVMLYQVKTMFPSTHWVRQLLQPHMRYQEVLNQAGLFSHGSNDPSSRTALDDVLYPGMLTNWDLGLFQATIQDVVLGYFKGVDHSPMAQQMSQRGFDLVNILSFKTGRSPMDDIIDQLQQVTIGFVRAVVDTHYISSDAPVLAMFNRNVLRYLKPGTRAKHTEREIFVLLVSRYILHVGHLHGLEHYMTNVLFAPLRLPQRIRTPYHNTLNLTDYYNRVDALNGVVVHRVYTRFRPGPASNGDDWSTIRYGFVDEASRVLATAYITHVQQIHCCIRDTLVQTCQGLWDNSKIDWMYDREYLMFGSKFLGTSISM